MTNAEAAAGGLPDWTGSAVNPAGTPPPSYYDMAGGRVLPGGYLSVSPGQGGVPRSIYGVDMPVVGYPDTGWNPNDQIDMTSLDMPDQAYAERGLEQPEVGMAPPPQDTTSGPLGGIDITGTSAQSSTPTAGGDTSPFDFLSQFLPSLPNYVDQGTQNAPGSGSIASFTPAPAAAPAYAAPGGGNRANAARDWIQNAMVGRTVGTPYLSSIDNPLLAGSTFGGSIGYGFPQWTGIGAASGGGNRWWTLPA
jgi:hypothetical protein